MLAAAALAIVATSQTATAARTPDHLDAADGLEVASGQPARLQRNIGWTVPLRAAAAWHRFVTAAGGRWRASWDETTGVPSHIYGEGISAPGTLASEAQAALHARAFLEAHADLLAPGAAASDFELVANDLRAGMRTVAFIQRYRGIEVMGGQLSLRYKNDRLFVIASEALPFVDAEIQAGTLDRRKTLDTAASWIAKDFGSKVTARDPSGPFVLPIVRVSGEIDYHLAARVTVDAKEPVGRFSVYLDAKSGQPLAREQTLMFASGTLRLNVPERYPLSTRVDLPSPSGNLRVDGAPARADDSGVFSWTSSSALSVNAFASGAHANVLNDNGPEVNVAFMIEPGGSYVWDRRDNVEEDAQIITMYATSVAVLRARSIAPDLRWLDGAQIEATVNMSGECNAFSDGETLNFYRASNRCENTGRITDVVYHEFGHALHAHAIIRGVGRFDRSLSEGISDFLAATITGDPGMGRGFFRNNQALRHIDPDRSEARWPEDRGESHTTGLIYAGAMWDLRKNLIASLGEQSGIARTETLYYETMRRAVDIPASYVETLAADDDDGNLMNGTPSYCEITDAFARHGLADPAASGAGVGSPKIESFTVKLPVTRSVECPGIGVNAVTLEWQLRRDPNVGGNVTFTETVAGFEGLIPQQAPGEVVRYRITARLHSGEAVEYPDNAADPMYEMFVGDVVPLYCTDFERDPAPEGWVHELVRGTDQEGADDWQWGELTAVEGSGDPENAFSGTRVYGNDLGGGRFNGTYQPNKTNALIGPVVDTMGHTNVRLQYRRWLNIENGFFDKATIHTFDKVLWANFDSGERGMTHHLDKEWRFQDVDLSEGIKDGKIQVRFQLESDGGLELGGWTLDDVCIVAFVPPPQARCGDGNVDEGEACDDGNLDDGDACKSDCTLPAVQPGCGNGKLDPGEACDASAPDSPAGCSASCTLANGNGNGNGSGNGKPGDGSELPQAGDGGCGCNTAARGHAPGALDSGWVLLAAAVALRPFRRHRRQAPPSKVASP